MGDLRQTARILAAAAGAAENEAGLVLDNQREQQKDQMRRMMSQFGFRPMTPDAAVLHGKLL